MDENNLPRNSDAVCNRRPIECELIQDNLVFLALKTDSWLGTAQIANTIGVYTHAVAEALVRLHSAGFVDMKLRQNRCSHHNPTGFGQQKVFRKRIFPPANKRYKKNQRAEVADVEVTTNRR
jgi:hypothetical protein